MAYVLRVLMLTAMLIAACTDDDDSLASSGSTSSTTSPGNSTAPTTASTTGPTATASTTTSTTGPTATAPTTAGVPVDVSGYLATRPPGSALPDEAACNQAVLAVDSAENRPDNATANKTVLPVPDDLAIDGADRVWNAAFAPRITGEFAGTTDQILRWGACKWGFDEDLTRARAVTESSWRMSTQGDPTDESSTCELIGIAAPCAQSYGLLQVKATVHGGTYPEVAQSTAFGVDYAMAWLRACFEGSFTWLNDQGYQAGDELGCIGTWFSGKWRDQAANDYIGTVRSHLEGRTWERYH